MIRPPTFVVALSVMLLGLACNSSAEHEVHSSGGALPAEPSPKTDPEPTPTPEATPPTATAGPAAALGPPSEASPAARQKLALALLGDGQTARALPVVASDANTEFDPELVTKLAARQRVVFGGPRAILGALAVDGELSPKVVEGVLVNHVDELSSCYASEWAKNKRLTGALTLRFETNDAGRVTKVEVRDQQLDSEAVGPCMTDAAKRWTFPNTQGPIKVDAPLRLLHVDLL